MIYSQQGSGVNPPAKLEDRFLRVTRAAVGYRRRAKTSTALWIGVWIVLGLVLLYGDSHGGIVVVVSSP
jgi:hypothetical protein